MSRGLWIILQISKSFSDPHSHCTARCEISEESSATMVLYGRHTTIDFETSRLYFGLLSSLLDEAVFPRSLPQEIFELCRMLLPISFFTQAVARGWCSLPEIVLLWTSYNISKRLLAESFLKMLLLFSTISIISKIVTSGLDIQ
jgi:hypothetical protein